MDFQPPISTRETEKLLEIIRAPEEWEPIALEQARIELDSRGIGIDEQKNREKSHKKYKKKSLFIKENLSYSKLELALMVTFGPVLIVLLNDFWIMSVSSEYKKKKRQGWLALSLGFSIWMLLIYFCIK